MKLKTTSPAQAIELLGIIKDNPAASGLTHLTADVSDALIPEVIKTGIWPMAVHPSMIVNDEPAKRLRAKSIIGSFVRESLTGKTFLEIGCGEGYSVQEAQAQGAVAFGYDCAIAPHKAEAAPTPAVGVITKDMGKASASGPYDVIMCYDVLDHVIDDQTRNGLLTMMKTNLKPGGRVYVRCHPFTSRHGVHAYYKFNKAYAQLFMTPEAMAAHGAWPTVQTIMPLMTYKKWFADAGLKIVDERLHRQDVEEFFESLAGPLMKRMADNSFVKDLQTLNAVLGVQFADFILQAG